MADHTLVEVGLIRQLCEVSGCHHIESETYLEATNYDLNRALELFFNRQKEGSKPSNTSQGSSNSLDGSNPQGINSNVIILDDELEECNDIEIHNPEESIETSVETKNPFDEVMEVQIRGFEEDVGISKNGGDAISEETEEEMMEKAMEASIADYKLLEPDVETTFQLISANYQDIDPISLRSLCQEYVGRSMELEIYLQENSHSLPTKVDVERNKLEDQLKQVVEARIEGSEDLKVEMCPDCNYPRIIEHPSVKVFSCLNASCGKEFCRRCMKEQHLPKECEDQQTNLQQFPEVLEDFGVISVKPKRNYDDNDELDREFRIAESQFLRLQHMTKKKFDIKSIDIVTNKVLKERFDLKQKEFSRLGYGDVLLLFHGTPQQNIGTIVKNNFDLSILTNGRAYGDGVYFSECPEVSIGYSRDKKSLLLCKVLPGLNSKEVHVNTQKKDDQRCWAIVVPDVDQILPSHIIHFTDRN